MLLSSNRMDHALTIFGFKTIHEVTSENLKRAFKTSIAHTHPDKGGQDGDFDEVVGAYTLLSNTVRRLTGGRDGFAVLHAADVKQARDEQFVRELNNMVSDVFEQVNKGVDADFHEKFNDMFEKNHERRVDERGYEEWFRTPCESEKPTMWCKEEIKETSISTADWNKRFEAHVTQGKPEPSALILHPDQMAFVSGGTRGTSIIAKDNTSFTSDIEACPEYTDLHDAYTSEHTIFDKVPVYNPTNKTLDELLNERSTQREINYQAVADAELQAISEYEKKRQQEEKEHIQKVAAYFASRNSSQWALQPDSDSFVKNIGHKDRSDHESI